MTLPGGRSLDYLIARACERWGFKVKGSKEYWEELDDHVKVFFLAYEQVRQYEE